MPEKIAVFVPPYKLSTRESDKETVREAVLLRELIKEAKSKGFQVLEMNHPRELWHNTDLEERRLNLLERLKRLKLQGKEVIFIGHSLGAFLIKANLKELPKLVGKPFKVITIGGVHSGGIEVPEGEQFLKKLVEGWEGKRDAFRELSEKPPVPKECELIEFYSPEDPILPKDPKLRRKRKTGRISRIPIPLIRKETGLKEIGRVSESFVVHHLFRFHKNEAVKRIRKHLR